jgi:tripartite-type tricarboxylate transporter receptor subunit TctC
VRARSLPDVPTMAEAGVPNYEVLEWNPVLAPAGIAADTRAKLVDAIRKALADSEVLGRIRALGGDAFSDPTQASAGKFILAQQAQWGKVIRERKIVVG